MRIEGIWKNSHNFAEETSAIKRPFIGVWVHPSSTQKCHSVCWEFSVPTQSFRLLRSLGYAADKQLLVAWEHKCDASSVRCTFVKVSIGLSGWYVFFFVCAVKSSLNLVATGSGIWQNASSLLSFECDQQNTASPKSQVDDRRIEDTETCYWLWSPMSVCSKICCRVKSAIQSNLASILQPISQCLNPHPRDLSQIFPE